MLSIQLISIGLSAYSTFKPIVQRVKLNHFRRKDGQCTLATYIVKELFFQTHLTNIRYFNVKRIYLISAFLSEIYKTKI